MKNITIDKARLMEILDENRQKHKEIYDAAVENYKKYLVIYLEKTLARAKKNKSVSHNIQLTKPSHNLDDYDRVIRMLELEVRNEIELTENEFSQYVLDNWNWRSSFYGTSCYAISGSSLEDLNAYHGLDATYSNIASAAVDNGIFNSDDVNLKD